MNFATGLSIVLVVAFVAFRASAQGPPPNDDCGNALYVTDGVNGTFNNGLGANTSTTVSCSTSAADVWFRYVATRSGTYTISTCTPSGQSAGTMLDTVLSVHASCLAPATTCNDDSCGTLSSISMTLVLGTSYFIRVASGNVGPFPIGSFWLTINPPAPTNDNCGSPITALIDGVNPAPPSGQSGYWFSDVNAGTSQLIGTPCPAFNEIWFTYVASQTGPTTITTCTPPGFLAGSLTNTVMSVHPGDCSAAIACNEDTCASLASVTFDSVAGQTYKIQVGGTSVQAEGTFYLTVKAPANDKCPDAIPITGTSVSGNNGLASTDATPPASCGSSPGKDVWYTYSNPSACSRVVTLSLCAADGGSAAFDSIIRVFSGADCASLTEIACNDDFCGTQSRVTFTAAAGTSYRISVSSDGGGAGPFTLDLAYTSALSLQVAPGCSEVGGAVATLSSNPPRLGQLFTMTITGGGANAGGLLCYGPPGAGGTTLPNGCLFSLDPFAFNILFTIATNGAGTWSWSATLPSDPAFECASYDMQAVLFPGPTYRLTSCMRLVLGN
jgi:hypothetical protein